MKISVPIADTRDIDGEVKSTGFQTLYNRACEKMAEMGMMDESDIILEFADGELRLLNPKNHEVLASVPAVPTQ